MWRARSETARMALQVVTRNPGRSALTVLGLTIGVGAFIAMVSFGAGARHSVMAQFEALGTNLIRITSQAGQIEARALPLTDRDVTALRREATTLHAVAPLARRATSVAAGAKQRRMGITGTSPEFQVIHDWPTASGGMFDEVDMAQRAKVCVIGFTVVRDLFEGREALGETLTVGGVLPCRVIGVLAEKGQVAGGTDLDDTLLLPATTYAAYLGLPQGYTHIEVQPQHSGYLEASKIEVTEVLRRSHRLQPEEAEDFRVSSPVEVTRAAKQTSEILTALLAGIAAISLLVGGIGIMNIQLMSVAERTREIGIRSAIGATPRQVLTQFLAEALVLSTVGTLSGVILGLTASFLIAEFMGFSRVIAGGAVLGSASFGIGVGIAFGFVPARRAARLDPIVALRHE